MQRVGHVLIGAKHRALILRRCLNERLFGGFLPMPQGAAVEYRRSRAEDDVPERSALREQLIELRRRPADGAGDGELR